MGTHRMAAVVALSGALVACSDDSTVGTAGDATNASEASGQFTVDTPWHSAVLSLDALTLVIEVGSSPEGDGPCEQRFEHRVIETETDVTVEFDAAEPPPTTEPAGCPAILSPQRFEIALDSVLGDRDVFNGVDPEPRPVWREEDVVRATVLPDEMAEVGLSKMPANDRGPLGWMQYAEVESGPHWDLIIDQMPEGSFTEPSTEPGAMIRSLTIHGHEAEMWEYFNFTGRMVHWTEGGLDITVRAEVHSVNQEPPYGFANPDVAFIDDELIAIAEGIEVP